MKKQSFRKRLCCSIAAVLSLFAICGNNLHAATNSKPGNVPVIANNSPLSVQVEITYNKGVIPTPVTGFPQTQTVAAGSDITITDMGVTGARFVLLGWNTMTVPLVTNFAIENLVTNIGEFYARGDLLTVTEDMNLYAVWAVDQNGDGKPDYGASIIKPTVRSVFPNGLPPFVDDEDDISLRKLPD